MNLLLITAMLIQQTYQTNPARIVSSATFRLYQTFISPSQGDVCNFSPSCSHFAKESIEEYGILWGSLMASDRLLRCNPWASESFDTYYGGVQDHKIHDPVPNNYILDTIKKEIWHQ
jgi:putative membrane protein insertion efficiency factor